MKEDVRILALAPDREGGNGRRISLDEATSSNC